MLRRIAALLLILAGAAHAASPQLAAFDPPGIQRGADTDVTISGDRLQDAKGLLIYAPGVQVLSMQPLGGNKVRARLHVAPDSPLGEHEIRVWTATGLSEMMPFYIGPYPNVACSGSNHEVAAAQPVPLNCTVNGVINDEEIDYYAIHAKKGDRITAEVEGMRLARDFFDPWAAILDARGEQLAANDDNALFIQDPLVSTIAPADGTYLVSVRESTWGGSPRSAYRMHIGTFPQPLVVYPSGGPAGKALPVTFVGDVKGPISATVQVPQVGSQTSETFHAPALDGGLASPGPLPMRASPFPNVLQQEPNHTLAQATAAATLPVAFNGILRHPRESDYYRFHATHGTSLDITVFGRQLRSPIDSALFLYDAKGRQLAYNDDAIGPDSYLQFDVPADGDYSIAIRDHLHRGGPGFVYRVEVAPVGPSVSFTEPVWVRDSQERQTVVIPRGNRYATTLRVTRSGFDGDFTLKLPQLPPGVTLQTGVEAKGVLPVIFQAAPDAALSATLCDVEAQPADPKQQVTSGYAQNVELLYADPNQYQYVTTDVQRLAVSVADQAPFQIDVVPPSVPLLEDGVGALHVTAIRNPGFTGPINVSMLYDPPGVSSQSVVTIPEKQDSADLPINATGDARTKTWQVAVIASGDAGQGDVWVSSGFVPLTIAKPFISGHIERANTVQGYPVSVTCALDQNVPFDGTATLRLMGLPTKVTAPDVTIKPGETQAVFNVATDAAAPAGQHKDLFCQVTVQKKGVPMVANTAWGGVLRIDAAGPKKEVAAK
jgi:hypothetical protein